MSMNIIRHDERGKTKISWLESYHTYSFAEYYDPQRMHYGLLRVVNDDTIQAHSGFGMHPHKDMEIISVVLKGALTHKDSMGSKGVIVPGMVQTMSAGSGVLHSEYNESESETRLLQIWIQTKTKNITPQYSEYHYELKENELVIVASSRVGAKINQDAKVCLCKLSGKKEIPEGFVMVLEGSFFVKSKNELKHEVASQKLEESDAIESDLPCVFEGSGLLLVITDIF